MAHTYLQQKNGSQKTMDGQRKQFAPWSCEISKIIFQIWANLSTLKEFQKDISSKERKLCQKKYSRRNDEKGNW